MSVNPPDEYQTLVERRDWLAARIKAKQSIGWDASYDEREHKALCWAIEERLPLAELSNVQSQTIIALTDELRKLRGSNVSIFDQAG